MATHSSILAWRILRSLDRGAWWAAVYGVAQSRTRLMRLSSSSSLSKGLSILLIFLKEFLKKFPALWHVGS